MVGDCAVHFYSFALDEIDHHRALPQLIVVIVHRPAWMPMVLRTSGVRPPALGLP